MKFYDRLYLETSPQREEFLKIPFLINGMNGNLNFKSYIAFLTEAYHHVKHTLPLLMACGSRIPGEMEWVRDAIAEYIEEEQGHQEWILNDIAACGENKEAVRNGKPGFSTEMMVAYAYDIIHRHNPVGFFGMVLVLEGTSVSHANNAAKALQQSLQLPKEAFSYLNSHGTLDQDHIVFYQGLMNRLEDKRDQDAVIHCANAFYQLYGNIFRDLPLNPQSESERRYA